MEDRIQVYNFRKGDIWQITYMSHEGVLDTRPCVILEDMKKKDHYGKCYTTVCLISGSKDYFKSFDTIPLKMDAGIDSNIMLNNVITVHVNCLTKFMGFIKQPDIDKVIRYIYKSFNKTFDDSEYIEMSDKTMLSDQLMKFFKTNFSTIQKGFYDLNKFSHEFQKYIGNKKCSPKTIRHILNSNNITCGPVYIYNVKRKNNSDVKDCQENKLTVITKENKQQKIMNNALSIFDYICSFPIDKIVDIFYNSINNKLTSCDDFLHHSVIKYDADIHTVLKQTVRAIMMRRFINKIEYSLISKQKKIYAKDIIPILEYGVKKYLDNKEVKLKTSA